MGTVLRRERQKQIFENKKRLDAWFDKFDTDKTGLLDKEQLRALLLFIYPNSEPSDEVLTKLLELGESFDTTGDGVDDTSGVSRASMQLVIERHCDYARQQKFIDDAFTKFDTNSSGHLERDQLLRFLDSLDKAKVDEGDVDFVLAQADVGATKSISPAELLPAVGVWIALLETGNESAAAPSSGSTGQSGDAPRAVKKSGLCVLL